VTNRTHESLHFGRYVYLEGDIAIERCFIEKYVAQIVHHNIYMFGSAASMNQEALNDGHPQLVSIDRRILTNTIHAFLVIQTDICFGHLNVSTPSEFTDFNEWAWHQFPRLLSCFIYLWTNHRSIIGPCGEHCSKCLIVDGHKKRRRRICAFKNVKVNTQEMTDLVNGVVELLLCHLVIVSCMTRGLQLKYQINQKQLFVQNHLSKKASVNILTSHVKTIII
jgi:hypothetical protein